MSSWLLAPLYVAAGRLPTALLAGTALLGAVSIVGTLRSARRIGGPELLGATAIALGALSTVGLRGSGLVDVWNPYLPLLAFVWFGLLAWEVGGGRWRSTPWLVGTGTLSAQSHLAYVPPVIAMTLAAIGLAIVGHAARPARRAIIASALTSIVLWLPPIIQQITATSGNLGRLWARATHGPTGSETPLGREAALGVLGRMSLLPEGGSGGLVTGPAALGVMVLTVLAAAGMMQWRTTSGRPPGRALIITATAASAMVLGTSQMVGDPYPWLFRPIWAIPCGARRSLAGSSRRRLERGR